MHSIGCNSASRAPDGKKRRFILPNPNGSGRELATRLIPDQLRSLKRAYHAEERGIFYISAKPSRPSRFNAQGVEAR